MLRNPVIARRWQTLVHTLSLLSLSLYVGACLDAWVPEVGPVIAGQCDNVDSDPETPVSFEDDILPMFRNACGCHDPDGPAPFAVETTGFSIDSWEAVMRGGNKSGEKIVVDGDACGSVLYQKCTSAPPFGARMPLYGPFLSASEEALIHDWIVEGAHED